MIKTAIKFKQIATTLTKPFLPTKLWCRTINHSNIFSFSKEETSPIVEA